MFVYVTTGWYSAEAIDHKLRACVCYCINLWYTVNFHRILNYHNFFEKIHCIMTGVTLKITKPRKDLGNIVQHIYRCIQLSYRKSQNANGAQ